MKIVFISDDGSKHKLVSLKYGLQYVLPILFIALSCFILFQFTKDLSESNGQSRPQIVEYRTLPRSPVEQINLRALNKKISELTEAVMSLAEQNNIILDSFEGRQHSSNLDKLNNPNRYIHVNLVKEDIERLEQSIKVQESQLNSVKSHFEYKELEDQALELYTDKSNGVRLISDFIMPVSNGNTTSRYGFRKDPINGAHRNHRGIDVAAPRGTSVKSIADGYVTFMGRRGAYGKVIEITHSDLLKSRYAHLHSYNVKMGNVVNKGAKIGEVGSTGRVTGPHLHLEVWKKGKTVDPFNYLKGIKYIDN